MSGIRFLVVEHCDDFEQVLGLRKGKDLPGGAVLDWCQGGGQRHAFPTRLAAREAINRTEHYRLAFDLGSTLPERKFCKIVPVSVP